MLTIRLQRVGRKNDPSFRMIVTDSKHKPKTGNALEVVGSYDPRVNRIDVKADRVTHWMQHGAQVSDTVHNILVKQKIVEGAKRNVSNPSGARLTKMKKTATDAIAAKVAAAKAAAAPKPVVEEIPAESNNPVAEDTPAQ
jgi:small subunit ribosomal protein S16